MPDSPDYQKYLPGSVRFSLQDMSELAARLGSPSTNERRGETIWYDTFAGGLDGWFIQTGGTGGEVLLAAGKGNLSGFSAQMKCGSSSPFLSRITRTISVPQRSSNGVEVSIYTPENITLFDIYFNFVLDGLLRQAVMRLDFTNNLLKYQSGSGIYTSIPFDDDDQVVRGYHSTAKMVVDTLSGTYKRFIYNYHVFDNLSYSVPSFTPFTFQYYDVRFDVTGAAGGNYNCYIKQVIFTSNEP